MHLCPGVIFLIRASQVQTSECNSQLNDLDLHHICSFKILGINQLGHISWDFSGKTLLKGQKSFLIRKKLYLASFIAVISTFTFWWQLTLYCHNDLINLIDFLLWAWMILRPVVCYYFYVTNSQRKMDKSYFQVNLVGGKKSVLLYHPMA